MPLFATLIHQTQLKQRPHIGPFTSQRNKQRDVGGIILSTLSVGVKVNGPAMSTHHKRVGGNVPSDPHAFGQGVSGDVELVGGVGGVGEGGGGGGVV